jgi:hypothetical protein
MADHHMIDDPLETANHVLNDSRPRQEPDGAADGTFDDRTIELLRRLLWNPTILLY